MGAVDLIEIEPGIYGVAPTNTRAHQWRAFWSMIRVLTFGVTIAVCLDLWLAY